MNGFGYDSAPVRASRMTDILIKKSNKFRFGWNRLLQNWTKAFFEGRCVDNDDVFERVCYFIDHVLEKIEYFQYVEDDVNRYKRWSLDNGGFFVDALDSLKFPRNRTGATSLEDAKAEFDRRLSFLSKIKLDVQSDLSRIFPNGGTHA